MKKFNLKTSAILTLVFFVLATISLTGELSTGKFLLLFISVIGLFVFGISTIIKALKKNKEDKNKPAAPIIINSNKPDYIFEYVCIAGSEHYEFPSLNINDKIQLITDPQNKYDNRAVAVYLVRENQKYIIGYISRDNSYKNILFECLSQGNRINVKINNIEDMQLDISVYGSFDIEYRFLKYDLEPDETFTIKVNHTDDNFALYDIVDIDYDDNYNHILSFPSNVEVRCPAQISDIIDNTDNVLMYVTDIEDLESSTNITIELFVL